MNATIPRADKQGLGCGRFSPVNSWLKRGQPTLLLLLFFVLFYGYVWWVIEPVLQYSAGGPTPFLRGSYFLKEFLSYPGGLVEYAAAFLVQFYRLSWLGALLTTTLASLLCLATYLLLGGAKSGLNRCLSLLPAPLLLLIQTPYDRPWLPLGLGLLFALWFAVAYIYAVPANPWLRWVCFIAFSVPLYYLAAGAFLVFALVCGLCELMTQRPLILVFSLWITASLLPYLAIQYFFVGSLLNAYLRGLPATHSASLSVAGIVLCIAIPLLLITGGFSQRIPRLKPALKPGYWLSLAFLAVAWSFDSSVKALGQIEYHAQNRQWPQVLADAPRLRVFPPGAVSDINWALFQEGKLLSDMFAYPQSKTYEFWLSLHESLDTRQCLKASDLLFELGQVNRAERMAAEDLELNGYHPGALQRLFFVHVLREDPLTAGFFLNLLEQTWWHRPWAQHYRRALAADPLLARDEPLQAVRAHQILEDQTNEYGTEALLLQSLRRNRRNRMAFEYLLAHYLLTSQMDKLIEHLPRLRDFSYPTLPRHCAEAVVLAQRLEKVHVSPLGGYTIPPELEQRFNRFQQQFMNYQGNLAAAQAGLVKEFGDTYWFFYLFDRSGSIVAQTRPQPRK